MTIRNTRPPGRGTNRPTTLADWRPRIIRQCYAISVELGDRMRKAVNRRPANRPEGGPQ